MKSRIFSASDVKMSSKGQLWIPGFIFIACFVAFPVCLLQSMDMNTSDIYGKGVSSMVIYADIWKSRILKLVILVAVGSALLNSASGFWYLYSRKKVDYYHSLPVKRSDMFWHKVYVGFLYYACPSAAMAFLAACIGAARGYFGLETFGIAAMTVLLGILVYLLVYFAGVLVVSITGNVLMGVLGMLMTFIYFPLLSQLMICCRYIFYHNVSEHSYGAADALFRYGSPVTLAVRLLETTKEGGSLPVVIIYVIVIIFLVMLSWLAFVKRPSEGAEKSLVYRELEPVVRLMVMVPSALGVGYLFYGKLSETGSLAWWFFGLAFGAVMSFGITGIILRMDFRGFFSGKIWFAAGAVLIAFCAVAYQKDLFGFSSYLPEYEQIAKVGFDLSMMWEERQSVEIQPDGRYIIRYYDEEEKYIDARSQKITPELYDILKSSLNNWKKESINGAHITVKYTLKSGRIVYRQYPFQQEQIQRIAMATSFREDFRKKTTSFLSIDRQYLTMITASFFNGHEAALYQDEKQKQDVFLEAIKEDYAEANSEDFLEVPCAMINFEYSDLPAAQTYDGFPVEGDVHRVNYSASLFVYPSFKRTIALLEETGYPLSMNEVEIERIELMYSVFDKDGTYLKEEMDVIEDAEQIAQLKNRLIPMNFWNTIQIYEPDVHAKVYVKNSNGFTAQILEGKMPDFVQERMKELQTQGTGE